MNSNKYWQAAVMTTVVASAGVYMPAAFAQAQPTNADLARLVQQQSEQIKRLNARLDAMEHQQPATSSNQVTQRPASGQRDAIQPGALVADAPATGNQPAPSTSTDSMTAMRQDIDELKKKNIKVDWSSGTPEFSSADEQYTFGIGGRIQYDLSSTHGSRFDSDADQASLNRNITGSEFRRLRLAAEGQLTDPILYKLEVDFAGSDVGLRDVYIAGKKKFELGEGVVYLGSKFSDSGMDGRTSSKWTWFVDRNTVSNDIDGVPGAYNIGVSSAFYGNHDDHISFAVTKGSTSDSNKSSNNFLVRSRAHWDPVNTGNTIVHVGANGYFEDFDRQRQPTFTDNSVIAGHYNGNLRVVGPVLPADTSTSYGFELAGLTGPFAGGAEYGRLDVDARNGGDAHLDAYSAQVGVSLTGEQFGYSTKQGVWTPPKIENPVNRGGIGAWQLMARYGAISSGGDFAGGSGHGTTLGVSWYLNNYMRVLLNDTLWQTNNRVPLVGNVDPSSGYYGHDDGNTINARAQIVF